MRILCSVHEEVGYDMSMLHAIALLSLLLMQLSLFI